MQDTIHIGLQQPPSPLMQADVTTHTQTRKQTYTLSLSSPAEQTQFKQSAAAPAVPLCAY